MKYLPIYLNITDKKILIVGGGKVAAFKVEKLLQFTREITVVARDVCREIREAGIEVIQSEYSSAILHGFTLAYACTDDRELNKRIKKDAEELKIPVNVVDDPDQCDFISPAVYTDRNFTVAVSTHGTAPSGAAAVRDLIKRELPPEKLNRIVEQKRKERSK
jgi:siroheme synthase-like protein